MPNSPFTRLVIFNIFWRSPCQVLRSAHHSSGDTSPTSSSLDHFAVSLSKQTDIVHAEGPQLDSCNIVRYTDQCCIGLKSQSECFTIRDFLMLPRIELIVKGLQKLRFAFIKFCCISESVIATEPRVRILISSTTREQDEASLLRPCIQEVHSVCSNRARLKYC